MKTRQIIALILACLMLAAVFTGCAAKPTEEAKTGKTQTEENGKESIFNVGSIPIVNEPITLKVLTPDPSGYMYSAAADSGYWDFLEEKTGIHFEIESYSAEELANKLPLIMATPDQMPDLFLFCNLKESDIINYASTGQLLKLNDLIEEYGSNIKTMFTESTTARGASVIYDGSIYGLPALNGSPAEVLYAINTRFLENCGLSVPTTLEELAEDMKIMRTMDANGDGVVGNELLWSCEPKHFKRYALSMVGISAYWPWQGVIMDDHDGEVFFVPTSEEYKYLLSVLRDMYAEGCIDPEIFTQTPDEYYAKFYQDLVFVSERFDDPQSDAFSGMDGWKFITPLYSKVNDEAIYGIGADYQAFAGLVSANTKYPEICMLLLDYMYSEEASMVSYYGFEGTDYVVKSQEPFYAESASPDFDIRFGYNSFPAPRWLRPEMVNTPSTELLQEKEQMKTEYGRFGWQSYVHLSPEQSDTVSVLGTDLGLFCDDYWVGFITGAYDLEKDWDGYVKQCESMGVAELVAVYQAAYNSFFE